MREAIRKAEILDIVNKYNYVTVEYLANALHISQSSIRRDLVILEAQELVKRDHGGVHSISGNNTLTPYELRIRENSVAKRVICQKAIELVRDGDTVFIDGSTTCLYLSDLLEKKKDITILTNSLKLAAMFEKSKNITVYCTGGLVRLNEQVTMGSIAEEMCRNIHTNIMFFSARAIDENGVITDLNEQETVVRKAAMQNTDKAVFLCDSTKFDRSSVFRVCNVQDVSCMVTEKTPDAYAEKNWTVECVL